jgi:PAS domain S-box-containing protein
MPSSDAFFRSLYDASPNPYLILDRQLNIASANRAYLESTKSRLSDIVGRWAWDAFPTDPVTLKQAIDSFERVIRTGEVDTMALLRFDIPRTDGGEGFETRYWSITHTPVFGADGAVEYVLQHPIDVTELERLRDAERDASARPLDLQPAHSGIFKRAQSVYEKNLTLLADVSRLQSLFAQAPSFMAVVRGPDHVYELVNHAVTALMGERDYVGLPVRDAVPELVGQGYIAILDQVYTTGKPFVAYGKPATIRRAPHAAPVECFLNFIYQPIFDAHGKVEGIFIEGNDVTEQYVSQRTAEERMRQEAQHKDEFLAMLAHELRNPLAPIGSAADLLALGRPNEATVARASAIIRRQVTHMSGLIDDLLDVSRVTRGLVTLARVPTDVVAVAREAIEQVRPLIVARHHRLDVDLPPQPVLVPGDAKRLVQVLANLLNNAAKYTPDGGAITLRLACVGQRVVIDVTDTGIGMTADVLASAFGLFTQAQRTPDRSQGGLGIGLALVKSIVELHDGTVTAASPGLDGGSTFTISLPNAQAPAPALFGPASDILSTGGRQRRVLIVDDNVDAAELLALFLAARGHHVMVEHSAAAALQCARDDDADVFMLDIGLPEMDGNALARRLRALPGMARATFIAITGYGTQGDRHNAAAAGFDHYLVKPVDMAVLLNLIE